MLREGDERRQRARSVSLSTDEDAICAIHDPKKRCDDRGVQMRSRNCARARVGHLHLRDAPSSRALRMGSQIENNTHHMR